MSKYLFLIESPGKSQKLKSFLGSDYDVMATFGHVADLPEKGIGIDMKHDFEATWEVSTDKKDNFDLILKKAKDADIVYLATDGDREGEGISWHLQRLLPKGVETKRVRYNAIEKKEVLAALEDAGDIDLKMVDSYLARRLLDRICGYRTSYLVKTATGGRSAGRVQSAALRILAEREKEIKAFVPVEYWPVEIELLTPDKKKVRATVIIPDKMDIKTEDHAKEVEKAIRDYLTTVETYDVKKVSRSAYPPFTTSGLQATASSMFGWDQGRTMSTAQKLYEGGHITYMRTDSTHIVPEQIGVIRDSIRESYGDKFIPPTPFSYKGGKNAQEAHEAIRPTHFENKVVSTGDESKLYTLIWKRTVASQAMPEIREQVRATFKSGKKVTSAASGSRQVFEGWKKVWDYSESGDTFLPIMAVGDKMDVIDVSYEQKFTEPPPRYGVASFNSKLEDLGIARPSTLAAVTKTLQDREYINTIKNVHHVSDLGIRVVDFLVAADICFADVVFTKSMEDSLDDILEGKTDKVKVLHTFWNRLKADLERAKGIKGQNSTSEYPCPDCAKRGEKKFLVKKFSRFGEFYSCEARTELGCEYKADVGKDGSPQEKIRKPKAEPSGFKCPKCSGNLLIRKGQFGDFLGCEKYPTCKTTANLDGTIKEKKPYKKKFWGKKKA